MKTPLTKSELATILNVTERSISNMLNDGMPAMRYKKILRFDLDKVKKWLEENHLKRNSEGELVND